MEYAVYNISYENALTFVNEMRHEDINTLGINVTEYQAIVNLYTNLLSRTRAFEYEAWLDSSDLTVALPVKEAMTTLSALYNILKNSNLHLRVYRAVENMTIAMNTPTLESHR